MVLNAGDGMIEEDSGGAAKASAAAPKKGAAKAAASAPAPKKIPPPQDFSIDFTSLPDPESGKLFVRHRVALLANAPKGCNVEAGGPVRSLKIIANTDCGDFFYDYSCEDFIVTAKEKVLPMDDPAVDQDDMAAEQDEAYGMSDSEEGE